MNLSKYFGRKVSPPISQTFDKRKRLAELRDALISLDQATGRKSNYWNPANLSDSEVDEIYAEFVSGAKELKKHL